MSEQNANQGQQGEILIYQSESGDTRVDVYLREDTIWMSQKNMARLYDTTPQNITQHIQNIYEDGELLKESTCKNYLQVQREGTRDVSRETVFYNLDMVFAVGYRVRSAVGMQFRNWTSQVLTEYLKKGFVMNDERLKQSQKFGQDYFDELLERIRDIRASEQRFYDKVKAIYALAVDYNPKLTATLDFFKTVQNKMLYAATGKTAAEIVMERADAQKDNMGLTSFKGAVVRKKDILIAKNYLTADEIDQLNRLVSMFLDHAEDMAKQNAVMTMHDWDMTVNDYLTFRHRQILQGKGHVSHETMEQKVQQEYEVYHARRLAMPPEDLDGSAALPEGISLLGKNSTPGKEHHE